MKLRDRIRRWWNPLDSQEITAEQSFAEEAREVAWDEFDLNRNRNLPFDPRGSWVSPERATRARGSARGVGEDPVPPVPANAVPPWRPTPHGPVVADPEAVSVITAHGGRLYVYADASGHKHVQTEAPGDPSISFREIAADGFLFYVQEGIKHPETWSVTFSHIPHHHLDVVWEGHPLHPHLEQTVCLVEGHDWEPDPDSKEIYPIILCRRCGRRRELSEVLVDRLPGGHGGRGWGGVRPVRDR